MEQNVKESVSDEFILECDFCGEGIKGYHPQHFCSDDNPHLHACKECVSCLDLKRYFVDDNLIQKVNKTVALMGFGGLL